MDFEASDFWDFSISLYGQDGVAQACLSLQDRHQVDVNFLFFCAWAAFRGKLAGANEVQSWHSTITEWHENVVRHLRFLRRELKTDTMGAPLEIVKSFRARLQKIEIDSEHIEQITLTSLADGFAFPFARESSTVRKENARKHIDLYFAEIGAEPEEKDRRDVSTILNCSFL
jgi:uncharacterized protein (TIGR02444 family)